MSLRDLTSASHAKAEKHPFVKLIFSGNISKEDYLRYLFNQKIVYQVLEDHARDQKVLGHSLIDLERTKWIQKDIDDLLEDTDVDLTLLDSTQKYIEYLDTIKTDPKKLLSHIYVRHMGDLSGGQMIAKKVPGHGRFYIFENPDELKTVIRSAIDDSMADEANVCFDFAIKLFDDLMDHNAD